MNSISQKSVTGVFWSLSGRFGNYFVKFIIGIILARILTPQDYGLIGVISVFFAIAQTLVNGGFSLAYIQKDRINEHDANTVFTVNFSISVVLYLMFYCIAPYIATLYNQPLLQLITRILSFVLIINAFNVVQQARLTRNLHFKKIALVTFISSFMSGIIGVVAAINGFGVWSLVILSLSNRFIVSIGLIIVTKYFPKFRFSMKSFREMSSFGVWTLFSNLLYRVFDSLYVLVIGKVFPISQVGFYTKSAQYQGLLANNTIGAINQVAFPVLSGLQQDRVQFLAMFKKFLRNSVYIVVPILFTFMSISDPFVNYLLTSKWAPMIPFINLLCLVSIIEVFYKINTQAIVSIGKSRLSFNLHLLKNILRIINIIITYKYGVFYILIGEVTLSIISLFVFSLYTKKFIKYSLFNQIRDVLPIIISSLIPSLFSYILFQDFDNQVIQLIFGFIVSLGGFVLLQYIFNKDMLLGFWIQAMNIYNRKGNKNQ